MADCELCGVARPTLCPIKVDVPAYRSAFPTGMWMGICEECTNASHKANGLRSKVDGKKCYLCGIKGVDLFSTDIKIPDFSEPYYKDKRRLLCGPCLEAAENAYNIRQKEKAHASHH
ncbi:MAG TPA: F420H2 dehydrogenase subunit FpoO [Candidatus Nanoarchaeia archaeon]|nr:F420H2 dehydrogenase subunit FpoO [Candidatus Nanoarchaeia archaeon]